MLDEQMNHFRHFVLELVASQTAFVLASISLPDIGSAS
jgi:hypothetical protein